MPLSCLCPLLTHSPYNTPAPAPCLIPLLTPAPPHTPPTQVHVFETTIRVLGGLLSGHVLLSRDPSLVPEYDSLFLRLATDLADRMLPAFDTRTGLPGNFVHLQKVREGSWAPLLVQLPLLGAPCAMAPGSDLWFSLLPPAIHMGSLTGSGGHAVQHRFVLGDDTASHFRQQHQRLRRVTTQLPTTDIHICLPGIPAAAAPAAVAAGGRARLSTTTLPAPPAPARCSWSLAS